jgi:ribosomal protein S7
MLIKKLRAFSTPKQKKQDIEAFRQEFDNEDFVTFLRKFRGSLIFRGKSSLSYKLLDRIRIRFKKVISIKDEDPEDGLEKAINMLVPVIGTSNVRRGRKVQTVPSFLKLRKRIVLINK